MSSMTEMRIHSLVKRDAGFSVSSSVERDFVAPAKPARHKHMRFDAHRPHFFVTPAVDSSSLFWTAVHRVLLPALLGLSLTSFLHGSICEREERYSRITLPLPNGSFGWIYVFATSVRNLHNVP